MISLFKKYIEFFYGKSLYKQATKHAEKMVEENHVYIASLNN